MHDEHQLGDALSRELHELVGGLEPRVGLADAAIDRRRSVRRRAGIGAGGLGTVAAVSAGLAVAIGGGGGGGGGGAAPARLGGSELHLAAYRFVLPRDATPVAATLAACALGAGVVVYPTVTAADESRIGVSTPDQPAIASAVTGQGGCVSMLLTNAYTPGSDLTPVPGFPFLDQTPITIDGDSGDIGTQEFIGGDGSGGDATVHGSAMPSGTENNELTLTIPTANGQDELLIVTAAGVSQAQLQSIVASGLDHSGSAPAARRARRS
jgi:hypothetical protein